MSKEVTFIIVGLLIAFAISSYRNSHTEGAPGEPAESGTVSAVSPNAYTQAIAARHRPSVVDFSATWCGPCHRYHPVFEAVKAKYSKDIDFDEKDVDANPDLAQQLGVGGAVPTTMFFDSTGKKVGQISGALPQAVLEESVKKLLAAEQKS